MVQNYMDYKSSRKDWESAYTSQVLDLLGFKYENRTEPFQGASGATHPVSSRSGYTIPSSGLQRIITKSDGPVRTQVIGMSRTHKQNNKQVVLKIT